MINEATELAIANLLESRDDPVVSVNLDSLEILIYLVRQVRQLREEVREHRQQLRRLQTTTDQDVTYLKLIPSGVDIHG